MTGRVNFNLVSAVRDARARLNRGLLNGGEIVANRAVSYILEEPKTGRIYPRRGRVHQASAPGEAPASDTGRLVESRRVEPFPQELRVAISFNRPYALDLELGTEQIAPRPYLRRALMESRPEILQAIIREFS